MRDNRRYEFPVMQETGLEAVTVCTFVRAHDLRRVIEIGTRMSVLRVKLMDDTKGSIFREGLGKDLVDLYLYLRQEGRVVVLDYDIAMQTIQYLKETN